MTNQDAQNKYFSFNFHLYGDKTLWILFFVLALVSFVEMYSASSLLSIVNPHGYTYLLGTQILFIAIGFFIATFTSGINVRNLKVDKLSLILWCLSFFLFCASLAFTEERGGSHRTILGVNPIELLKITTILYVCATIAKQENPDDALDVKKIWPLYASGLIATQNLSSCLIIFIVSYCIFFIGSVTFKRIAKFTLPFIVLSVMWLAAGAFLPHDKLTVLHITRAETHVNRIKNFFSDNEEKENVQTTNTKIAIACSNLYPIMPGNGTQKDFLPNAHDDFVFAIIVEEFGYIAAFVFVILPFIALLYKIGKYSYKCELKKERFVMMGCGIFIVLQAFIHIATNCDIIPITGQALPLISKGGTSILVISITWGIIQSCINSITLEKDKSTNKNKIENETKSEIPD